MMTTAEVAASLLLRRGASAAKAVWQALAWRLAAGRTG